MTTLTIIWGSSDNWPSQTIQVSPNGDGLMITTEEGMITVDAEEVTSLLAALDVARDKMNAAAGMKPH